MSTIHAVGTERCERCGERKPHDQFPSNGHGERMSHCQPCDSDMKRVYRGTGVWPGFTPLNLTELERLELELIGFRVDLANWSRRIDEAHKAGNHDAAQRMACERWAPLLANIIDTEAALAGLKP